MKIKDLKVLNDANSAITFAISELKEQLVRPEFKLQDNSAETIELKKYIPYCLHETSSDGVYILLNRFYKPLGLDGGEWVNYEDFQNLQFNIPMNDLIQLTASPTETVLWKGDESPFNGKIQARKYLKKLEKLLSHTVKIDLTSKAFV